MLATMMVSGVGPEAVSGVGLVTSINMLVMNAFTAVATGVTVIVAQCIGRNHRIEAGRAASQSIVLVVYISIVLGALLVLFRRPILEVLFYGSEAAVLDSAETYFFWSSVSLPFLAIFSTIAGVMRAAGNARTPMVGSILSNLGYLAVAAPSIYLLHIGVAGAGLGLSASRMVPAIFLMIMLRRGRGIYVPKPSLKLDFKILRPVMGIAVPAGVDSIIFNGGKLLVQVFMAGMGTAVLSANAIASSMSAFLNLPGGTLQIISVTVVGQLFGRGDIKGARRSMLRFTWGCMVVEAVLAILLWLVLPLLMPLYTPTPDAAAITWDVLLLIFICTPLFWAGSFILPNGLRAAGNATFTMWVSIISMIVLRVAGAWFFGVYLGWGLVGIWLSMVADWIGRGVCSLWKTLRLGRADGTETPAES